VADAQGRGHWNGREELEQEDPDREERVDKARHFCADGRKTQL